MKTMNIREVGLQFQWLVAWGLVLGAVAAADDSLLTVPLSKNPVVFEERDGLVAVEAEHFVEQSKASKRAWFRQGSGHEVLMAYDADRSHGRTASGGAYLECLPDSRHNHHHQLIDNENFANTPGRLAVLSYKIHFNRPGRYYVWVRAYSTGTEDNGIHVGLDGEWPESGQRVQWCQGKHSWRWESKQRTQAHPCGEPYRIFLDIESAGEHTVQFSMREDGFEFDKFLMTTNREFDRPQGTGPQSRLRSGEVPELPEANEAIRPGPSLVMPRLPAGDGTLSLSGELKQWHKITLTQSGPYAHELDNLPNPFRDLRMTVTFTHQAGGLEYQVPGYFAADGNAADSSAVAGTQWRAHFVPDRVGSWNAKVSFVMGKDAAIDRTAHTDLLASFDGVEVSFPVAASDKEGRDLRAKGRLQYVGQRYLRFAGTGEFFLKAGADAPETFLGYADFDGTEARKRNVPLKTWAPHLRDWREGDPVWKKEKGKGMIGALNYLAGKGCNVFSFLPYNAGGDGDNIWPFVSREDKFHYDCSKLDQWGIVFDHGTRSGHYLHFKLQENEIDDNVRGQNTHAAIPESLDGGDLGPERKLYCRELVARFAHALALNWNLGEENTQSTQQQRAMAQYIRDLDPYDHLIVVHTFPNQQDKVYRPLLGDQSVLSGMSLQNSHISDTHWQTVKWVNESLASGQPWVVAFDESGSAAHGQVPDWGYEGFAGVDSTGERIYSQHEVRKQTLWGALMGGGAGVEYYFGYRAPQNDLICEDWRSRDQSWDYCRYALAFFETLPFAEMKNADELVGNPKHDNSIYCFAKAGEVYVVYLPEGGAARLNLSGTDGEFEVRWYDPRNGGGLQAGTKNTVQGGRVSSIGLPPEARDQDWVAVVR